MITISVSNSSDSIIRSHVSFSRNDYGPYSSTIKRVVKTRALFIKRSPTSPKPLRFNAPIWTGPPSDYGEKECVHPNISGDIFLDQNFQTGVLSGNPDASIYRGVEHWPIIQWGQDGTFTQIPIYAKNSGVPLVSYFIVKFVDDCAVCAWVTRLNDKTNQYGVTPFSLYVNWALKRQGTKTFPYAYFDNLESALAYLGDFSQFAISGTQVLSSYAGSPSTADPVAIASSIMKQTRQLGHRYECYAPTELEWGEMAFAAVNSNRYVDTVGLQFFAELTSLKGAFRTIFQGFTSVKAASRAYLSWQYGVQSQKRDMANYVRGLKRFANDTRGSTQVVRSSYQKRLAGDMICYSHYKVRYSERTETVLAMYRLLDKWSLVPNMSTAWDLVPFSFVFDWFTNFSQLLEKMDHEARVATYSIREVTYSYRIDDSASFIWTLMGMPDGVGSNLSVKYYRRNVRPTIHKPKLALLPPDSFGSIPEATALAIALK